MKRALPVLLLLTLGAAFLLGAIALLNLRLNDGSVYPAYSSLRSDPLGTMAFLEALQRLPELNVRRNFSTRNPLAGNNADATTYFHIGARMYEWHAMSGQESDVLKAFVESGGRLIVTFYPDMPRATPTPTAEQEPERRESAQKKRTAAELFGVQLHVREPAQEEESDLHVSVQNVSELPLPPVLMWHSGIVFGSLDPAWKPIYVRDNEPVVIERVFGKGSAVLASDSYFLSNEAMLNDRQPGLLVWLVGSSRTLVFDEAHFGITENPGVAALVRRYRLQGVVGGLLLLAILFVWKQSTSLLPAVASTKTGAAIQGRDAASGFVNLLRRTIPRDELFAVCFTVWRKSAAAAKYPKARVEGAESAFKDENFQTGKGRDVIRAYKNISSILERQNR